MRVRKKTTVAKIVSGGQTGADRAALDAAIDSGVPHGGWCPRGRRAEDGAIPEKYALKEATSTRYDQRTELNVQGSDGTVVFAHGRPTGGSALTVKLAKAHGKPLLELDLERLTEDEATERLWRWMIDNGVAVLNVAGSRESKAPGIGRTVQRIVRKTVLRSTVLPFNRSTVP